MFYFYSLKKKEVHRWASRSPRTLQTFMQNLCMFICGANPSILKTLRGFEETKEHELPV